MWKVESGKRASVVVSVVGGIRWPNVNWIATKTKIFSPKMFFYITQTFIYEKPLPLPLPPTLPWAFVSPLLCFRISNNCDSTAGVAVDANSAAATAQQQPGSILSARVSTPSLLSCQGDEMTRTNLRRSRRLSRSRSTGCVCVTGYKMVECCL